MQWLFQLFPVPWSSLFHLQITHIIVQETWPRFGYLLLKMPQILQCNWAIVIQTLRLKMPQSLRMFNLPIISQFLQIFMLIVFSKLQTQSAHLLQKIQSLSLFFRQSGSHFHLVVLVQLPIQPFQSFWLQKSLHPIPWWFFKNAEIRH